MLPRTTRSPVALLRILLVPVAIGGAASCAASGAGDATPEAGVDATTGDDAGTDASDAGIDRSISTNDSGTTVDSGAIPDTGTPVGDSSGGITDSSTGPLCDASTTNDPNNCGSCGNVCMPADGGTVVGAPRCANSTCTFTCPGDAGVTPCGADAGVVPGCYDLNLPTSCGACGYGCVGNEACFQGQCCQEGGAICGGMCTDITSNPNHCGSCDAGCSGSAAQCVGGTCVGYTTSTPTASFVNACSLPGHHATLVNDSLWTAGVAINLPFPFSFYGQAQTQVWLQSTGAIGFGAPSTGNPPDNFPQCNPPFPDSTTDYPAAMAFADPSLATGIQGVCYATVASDAGAGQFIVTWNQTTETSDPGSVLTFSMVLSQSTNTIDFVYKTMDGGMEAGLDPIMEGVFATVGLQLGNGSMVSTPYSCNTTFIPSLPFDLRFTPVP